MDEFDRRYFDPATAKYVELNSNIIKMTTLFFHAEAGLYFAKTPDFVAEALKAINPNADAIVLKCPFEDRGRRCCQSNANQSPNIKTMRISRRQLTSFGHGRSAVLLECFAWGEMTFEIEVVEGRSVN